MRMKPLHLSTPKRTHESVDFELFHVFSLRRKRENERWKKRESEGEWKFYRRFSSRDQVHISSFASNPLSLSLLYHFLTLYFLIIGWTVFLFSRGVNNRITNPDPLNGLLRYQSINDCFLSILPSFRRSFCSLESSYEYTVIQSSHEYTVIQSSHESTVIQSSYEYTVIQSSHESTVICNLISENEEWKQVIRSIE